jgi:CubicO group peptidase (beta-lactamase class C family)
MDDPEVYVNMPDSALPSALPKGWTVSHPADPLTVVGPEGDLRISYFSVLLGGSVDDQVRSAWRQLDPAFDKPVRYQAEMPSTEGWDSVMQIVYDMPANESRLALAIVRMLGERAYINLIDGTKAAFSRRLAQISEIGKAWRPAGFREPSLAGTEPKSFGDAERNAMSDFIRSAMRQLRIPGVAVAIVQNGETVYAEGFGVRRAGNNDPVTPTTRFMIGSSTKPLTTLMMAKLVDMGCFAWTTPVAEVLPGFSLSDAEVTSKLEMRHTVSASTGMPRRDVDLLFRFQGIRPENRIAEMKAMLPTTGFGETFQYSNYLVAAGGYAAAHSFAPGSSLAEAYERAMGQLVFEPLGMGQTSILCNDSPEEAAPHGPDLEGNSVPIDPAMERFADAVAPAGSVWSTILDMMKYVRCELQNGVNDHGEQVVSVEGLMARRQPVIKIDGRSSYGLGLFLTERQGIEEVMHGGNTLGFTSDMLFLPKHGIGLVILTNLRAANTFLGAVHQRLLELLFGATAKADAIVAAASTATEDSLERIRQRVKTAPAETAWIEKYAGSYRSEELGPARIFKREAGFRVDFESWSSDLGVEEQSRESRQIVLTCPPWQGGLRLQVSDDSSDLILDGGQTMYRFARID